MPLRVAIVVVAYAVYRVPGDDDLAAGLALGLGTLLVGFVAADRATQGHPADSRVPEIVRIAAGLALIAVGVILALA